MLEDRSNKVFLFSIPAHLLIFIEAVIKVLLKGRHAHIFKNMGDCEFLDHIPVMVLNGALSSEGANVWKRSV